MYNITFLTKKTAKNSFLVLFLNLKIAAVRKSTMAATTETLKYVFKQKQLCKCNITGQTFSVDLFCTWIKRDHF